MKLSSKGRSQENSKEVTNNSTTENNKNTNDEQQQQPFEWGGDAIPKGKLEKARKKFGLTNEQMDNAIKDAKDYAMKHRHDGGGYQSNIGDDADVNISTLTMIKWVVQLSLFALLIYVINAEYDNVLTIWFIRTFPIEAEILGITNYYLVHNYHQRGKEE